MRLYDLMRIDHDFKITIDSRVFFHEPLFPILELAQYCLTWRENPNQDFIYNTIESEENPLLAFQRRGDAWQICSVWQEFECETPFCFTEVIAFVDLIIQKAVKASAANPNRAGKHRVLRLIVLLCLAYHLVRFCVSPYIILFDAHSYAQNLVTQVAQSLCTENPNQLEKLFSSYAREQVSELSTQADTLIQAWRGENFTIESIALSGSEYRSGIKRTQWQTIAATVITESATYRLHIRLVHRSSAGLSHLGVQYIAVSDGNVPVQISDDAFGIMVFPAVMGGAA